MTQKRILIAFLADPAASPRPRQMIQRCVSAGYEIALYCLPSAIALDHKIHPICESLKKWKWRRKIGVIASSLFFFILRSRSLREHAIRLSFGFSSGRCPFSNNAYDAVIVQDLFLLPYCLDQAQGVPVIFDAREFYPKQREGDWLFDRFEKPLRDWICREYLRRCAKVFTVSTGLARAYAADYGITPTVLRSTPSFQAASTPDNKGHSEKIRLVHMGAANPNRKIENMVEVFRRLENGRFSFDLYLVGEANYIQKLRQLANGLTDLRICEPVAPANIPNTLTNYDLGFYYLEPKGFNLKHSLPNKFFEFIQARLAITIGPSPEMKTLVDEFACGFVAPEFSIDAMVRTLNAITDDSLQRAKAGSDQAAQVLCSEIEWKKVDRVLEELLASAS